MKILVLGAYYSNNLGDGVICECVASRLRRHFPEAEILVKDIVDRQGFELFEGVSYEELRRRTAREKLRRIVSQCGWDKILMHEEHRLHKNQSHIAEVCEERYDLAVVAGGQLFMDRYFLFLTEFISRMSKKQIPVYLNACGTGPAYSKTIRERFSESLTNPCVRLVSCRDDSALVQKLYAEEKIRVEETYDPALWCSDVYGIKKDINSDLIGLGLMYTRSVDSEKAAVFWIKLIRQLEKKNKKWKIFVNGSEDDIVFAKYVISKMPELVGSFDQYCMPAPKRPKELVWVVSQFKGIISFRLHSHIIAASLDVPSIALVWDQKLRIYFQKIGHGERCMTVKAGPEKVIAQLEKAEMEGYDRSMIEAQKQYADQMLYSAISRDMEMIRS
ncbi:MAG: polysaccharide pyruvyl transferase family protein [Fusicatenibacter sp.]